MKIIKYLINTLIDQFIGCDTANKENIKLAKIHTQKKINALQWKGVHNFTFGMQLLHPLSLNIKPFKNYIYANSWL